MNHPVAIVFVDPWLCLSTGLSIVLILLVLLSLWRRTAEARLMATLEDQLADIFERAALGDDATRHRQQARQWRRLAWPRRTRPTQPAREAT